MSTCGPATGAQAALDAYDTADPNTARAIAAENLAKPAIQAAVAEPHPERPSPSPEAALRAELRPLSAAAA